MDPKINFKTIKYYVFGAQRRFYYHELTVIQYITLKLSKSNKQDENLMKKIKCLIKASHTCGYGRRSCKNS